MTRSIALCAALALVAPPVAAQHRGAPPPLLEQGPGTFAALSEIVALLTADPATDWSHVDIPALADHLADMDRVFSLAEVRSTQTPEGAVFDVTGTGPVVGSIQRMATAHGITVGPGWTWAVTRLADGARVTVTGPDPVQVRALGFRGLLAMGDHHRTHHLALATGHNPHGH
ncbi:hypothetical protein [Jannaschia pohangensis]|uniref:Uncharacterized protein n=1 Tax=Jannaschia pohangensis TaxID=390807 RepID=A0A1I3UCY4_9RHOB|nr:hypothetical protein [Jannaschia pohangensis]SFJ80772.1 hypothetical protein SAMN04488095_3721 [Jannaschia pohangensis]